ncbi:MAG TPA: DUF1192 domain-containing protein [Beijerinckiaceae bacterium]|jgi:uncharacterized small protein (DUF1192 family)|nr:DUF1192 domain-containing protein [Beijerinckiaceae bacterium]
MARQDDEPLQPIRKLGHQVGEPLAALSIAEIDERVRELHNEIQRLEEDKRQKLASKNEASAVFKMGS